MNKSSIKQRRALMFLELMEENNLSEISQLLNVPLSTIQKHDNALKRLTGRLGTLRLAKAQAALRLIDAGCDQVSSIKFLTDHKMVSDLVAMRWAINARVHAIASKEIEEQERQLNAFALAQKSATDTSTVELRVVNRFREPIHTLSEAFNEVLAFACIDESPEYDTLMSELSEAVINLEDTLKS